MRLLNYSSSELSESRSKANFNFSTSSKTKICLLFTNIKIIFIILLGLGVFTPSSWGQTAADSAAEATKYTIKDYLEKNLPPNPARKIALDELTGLLTISDTPSNQALIKRLIKDWDVGPKQIFIEAKIIETTITDLDEIGVEWLLKRAVSSDSNKRSNIYIGSGTAASPDSGSEPPYTGTNMNIPAEFPGFGVVVGKVRASGSELSAYIKALQQKGKANLLSSPKITTLSGQMANIQVMTTIPYAKSSNRINMGTTAANGQIWVETYEIAEENYGISLEVTPTVSTGSDVIKLDIHPEVTNLVSQIQIISSDELANTTTYGNLGWPVIDTRTTKTSVMIKTGETIVMGGLLKDEDATIVRKVPILGNIPYIGEFFKSTHIDRTKKNLVIFLTASLIDTEGEVIQ